MSKLFPSPKTTIIEKLNKNNNHRQYLFIYLLYITTSHSRGVCTYHTMKRTTVEGAKARRKREKEIFPFMPFKLQVWPQRDFHPLRVSYNRGNSQLWHLFRVKGSYTRTILPHKPPSYTPVIHHSPCWADIQISFFNNHTQYQSTSSAADLLSDYLHTPLHTLTQQFYHSPFSPHGRTTGEYLNKSICPPLSLLHTSLLSVHLGLYQTF